MRAGKFDRTITIERASEAIDDFGTVTPSWATLFTLRARRRSTGASDKVAETGSETVTTQTFVTRFVDGITLEDRVMYDDDPFLIMEIQEIGRRRGLQIRVERAGP